MWTGRRFLMKQKILAVGLISGERVASYIPAGEVVLVLSGPTATASRLVDIEWGHQNLSVFAMDLETRAKEVTDASSK
jgi:hypothetical protein